MMVFSRILAVCLACAMLASAEAPDRAKAALDQAVVAHRKGDLTAAAAGYREAIKLNPNLIEARSNLGAALAGMGRYEEAIAEYNAALDLSPRNPGVRMNLALARYKTGQIREAAATFEELHALVPKEKRIAMLLADCWLRMGVNAKVVELLAPFEAESANDLAFTYVYGTALIRSRQAAKGQVWIDRILRNGESAEARLLIGMTKMDAGEYPAAQEDLEKAVKLNPKLPEVNSYYGMVLTRNGDVPGAMKAFEAEIAHNPNDFNANLNLGALLRQDQDYDKAMAHLQRALAVRPGDPAVRYQIANVQAARDENEVARAGLEQLVKEYPQFTEAHVTLATVYYRLGRREDGDRHRNLARELASAAKAKEAETAKP